LREYAGKGFDERDFMRGVGDEIRFEAERRKFCTQNYVRMTMQVKGVKLNLRLILTPMIQRTSMPAPGRRME
jgi:hypothetical protein